MRGRQRWLTGRRVFIAVTLAILIYLVMGPLLVLLVASIQDTALGLDIRPPVTWTLQNYVEAFFTSSFIGVLWTTLVFTLGSLVFAFVFSFALSMLIERTDMPLRNAMFILVVAPSGIPAVILAISWSLLVNPTNGVINVFLRDLLGLNGDSGPFNIYSVPWMILVQGMALVPLTFLLITASCEG